MQQILAIATAGALGTLARYGLSGLAHRLLGARFAWGTLAVNLLGCLLLGLLMHYALSTTALPRAWRAPLTIGFCGGFTTFSTFSYETLRYLQDGALGLAAANALASVALGLLCVWAGLALGRLLTGGL